MKPISVGVAGRAGRMTRAARAAHVHVNVPAGPAAHAPALRHADASSHGAGAQAEQLPPAHAEPANFAQSSSAPQVPQVLTPHAPVWASHCSPAPHATPAHGSVASSQRAPPQPAAHLCPAPRTAR